MLPRVNRLKEDRDFKTVLKLGRSFYTPNLKLRLLKNNLPVSRFGFVIGLKTSKKSTVRNRLRRQVRETVRLELLEKRVATGFDVMINLGVGLIEKKHAEIKQEALELLKKSGLLL